MCGILGYLGGEFDDIKNNEVIIKKMSDQIFMRGPDSSGIWIDSSNKIALGHRRLAVVELSEAGHQPMSSNSKRYVMTYNGEIYNNVEIRTELSKYGAKINWRGQSDTETLLAGFDVWGIKKTISRAEGMFAIAIWDKKTEQLILVRDRVGEKPLYYGWQGSGSKKVFIFGSELKALKKHPEFLNEIDRNALALYLRYSYVPAPYSIYKGIMKVEPGEIVTISPNKNSHSTEKYWSALDVINMGTESPFDDSFEEITDNLEKRLKKTISQQMMADVPLGAFLSGGIDSSLVVALMQAQSSRPIKTFTIGFNEAGFNEAEYAKSVASHLRTDHTELYVSSKDALDVIPKLPNLYCEPFADSSQIPTYLVSSLARQYVTVSLSGDGGDELFCGYNRYIFADKLWKNLKIMPISLRTFIEKTIKNIPSSGWNRSFKLLDKITPKKFNGVSWGDKLQKGAGVISSNNLPHLYHKLVSNWQDPSAVVINNHNYENILFENMMEFDGINDVQKMMTIDTTTYLPDDILVKVDRAAMGVSLETRVPFLDHNIVEFASKIPLSMKLKNGIGKLVLRDILYRHVPRELIERPKMGFGVPIAEWLRGPLKGWGEELLNESVLKSQGYFNSKILRKMWSEHLNGTRNWQSQLWAVLMFQAWLEDNS